MQHDNDPFYPSRDPEAGLRDDQRRFLAQATVSLGLPSLFYASLRDPRLFRAVVGRPLDSVECETATVAGFRVGIVNAGTGFPGIFPAESPADKPPECLLVHGLTRFEQTMIAWYEWDEYVLERIPLGDGRTAQAFVPDLEAIEREYGRFEVEPWSFAAWRSSQVDRALASARRWMSRRPSDAALVKAGCFPPGESPAGSREAG